MAQVVRFGRLGDGGARGRSHHWCGGWGCFSTSPNCGGGARNCDHDDHFGSVSRRYFTYTAAGFVVDEPDQHRRGQ